MPRIKSFQFHLSRISGRQNRLIRGLLEFLPASGVRDSFHLAIRKALQKYVTDIRYFLERVEVIEFKDFFLSLPSPCCVALIGMQPFKEEAFVEIDPALSYLLIEKLLGGKGERPERLNPLTETEQGVIEFLLLKLLSEIHKLCGREERLHFRLKQMVLEAAHLRDPKKDAMELVCLKNHVSLLNKSGFVNVYLPSPWVLEGFLKEIPSDRKSADFKEMKENIGLFSDLKIPVWGELGGAKVSYRDLKNLEEGDVILFDESGLGLKKGSWEGEVVLRLGYGKSGGLKGFWKGFQDGGSVLLTLGGKNNG